MNGGFFSRIVGYAKRRLKRGDGRGAHILRARVVSEPNSSERNGKPSRWKLRHANRAARARSQLRARALNATALFAKLRRRGRGYVDVEREKKD